MQRARRVSDDWISLGKWKWIVIVAVSDVETRADVQSFHRPRNVLPTLLDSSKISCGDNSSARISKLKTESFNQQRHANTRDARSFRLLTFRDYWPGSMKPNLDYRISLCIAHRRNYVIWLWERSHSMRNFTGEISPPHRRREKERERERRIRNAKTAKI